MVIVGVGREREAEEKLLMAMGTDRSSKPLHNFSMPVLKWGNQRFLRCVKVNSDGGLSAVERRSSASKVDRGLIGRRGEGEPESWGSKDRAESFKVSSSPATIAASAGRKSKPKSDRDDGIEAVKQKLLFDLQTATDKIKDAILTEGLEEESPTTVVSADADAVKPWNLRTRRAACKAPDSLTEAGGDGGCGSYGAGTSLQLDVVKPNFSPARTENKSPIRRGGVVPSPSGEKRDRAKFSVSLSRREIEEDFMTILGHRPARRPKKRAKVVQKTLDTLFPGLWLTEVNADLYKVPEAPETGKR